MFSKVKYLNGPQDGREDGEVARDSVATKEDRLVPRLLLRLREGNLYGHRLEERLDELGFGGMCPGEMYRILWQMEQEGMLHRNREGGGFRVPLRWCTLAEVGEAFLESYAGGHSCVTGRRRIPSRWFKTIGPGRMGAAGEGRATIGGANVEEIVRFVVLADSEA